VLQAGGGDTVGPLLVFLDLLECQPESVREIGLAHVEYTSPHAHAAANMLVDRIESAPRHRFPHWLHTACGRGLERSQLLIATISAVSASALRSLFGKVSLNPRGAAFPPAQVHFTHRRRCEQSAILNPRAAPTANPRTARTTNDMVVFMDA
jgi:hypothetical protein